MLAATLVVPLAACARSRDPVVVRLRWALETGALGSLPLPAVFDLASDLGIAVVDLRRATDEEAVRRMGVAPLRSRLSERGLTIGLVGAADAVAAEVIAPAAAALGAEGVVVSVPGPGGLSGDTLRSAVQSAATKLAATQKSLADRGLALVVENRRGTLVDSAHALQALGVDCPAVKQAVSLPRLDQTEQSWAVTLENIGPRVVRITLPAAGPAGIDWNGLLESLDRIAYAGHVSIDARTEQQIRDARAAVEERLEAMR